MLLCYTGLCNMFCQDHHKQLYVYRVFNICIVLYCIPTMTYCNSLCYAGSMECKEIVLCSVLLYSYLDLDYLYSFCCWFFSFHQNFFSVSWLGLFVSAPSTFDIHTLHSSVTHHAHWFDGNRQCSLCVEVVLSQYAQAGSSLCDTLFCFDVLLTYQPYSRHKRWSWTSCGVCIVCPPEDGHVGARNM